MVWTDSSWVTHARFLRNPCCKGVITLLTWSYRKLKTQRSRTLLTIGRSDMGRYFTAGSFESYLWMGVMSADFHSVGIWPLLRDWLKIPQRLRAICLLHSISRRAGMPSGSQAFELSSPIRCFVTSSTDTCIWEISFSVLSELFVGSMFTSGVADRKTEQKYLCRVQLSAPVL